MIDLRPIRDSDVPRVDALFREAFELGAGPRLEFVANLSRTDPEGCLVVEVGGEVVGYAISHRSGSVGYIGNLAVAADRRREGLGKALTLAVRDHLAERCDVVGLAVDANNGRNIGLYASCGFVATLPSCHMFKRRADGVATEVPETVSTARELGSGLDGAIDRIGSWSTRVLPGLDLTRDLRFFAETYPDRLWLAMEGGEPRGFLAQHEHFRSDPWGAMEPRFGDHALLNDLIDAMETSTPDELLWMHVQTNFRRLPKLLAERGYRVSGHRTCMVLESSAGAWPAESDSLFVRPWWT